MEQTLTSRRFLAAVGVVVLVTGVCGVWIGLGIDGTRVTLWVDDGLTPLAALAACVLCFRASAGHIGRMRLFWTLMGCAMASWTLAEVIWGYYALILDVEVPVPSWADVGYLSAIPLAVAALVVHPATSGGGGGTRKARSVFDGLVIATALMFLSWTLVIGPVWRSADLSTWTGVVTLAYPFGDVVIVFFIVLAIRGMTGSGRLSLWCLLGALLVMAISDSTFAYLTDVTTYTSPGLIDTGWIAAYLGIALAAFSSRPGGTEEPAKAVHAKPSLASLISPLLPVLLALSVAAVQIRLGHHLDRAAWLMAFGLIALVLARQGLMMLELLAPSRHADADLMQRLTHTALGGAVGGEGPGSGYEPL
jgi:predicted ribosomally synthesized peptide with SipW-like signal peptide